MREAESRRTVLLLIRHGQSYFNRDGERAGPDSELTSVGWSQARALAEWVSQDDRMDALYTSSMIRAQQTASVIAEELGMTVGTVPDLQEAEERYWHELPANEGPGAIWSATAWQPSRKTSPIYFEFTMRVCSAVSDIIARHVGERIAIVGHGGAWASLIRALTGGHRVLVATDNCGVHKLVYGHGRWMIRYLNRVPSALGTVDAKGTV